MSTRTERAGEAARERVCNGVRGERPRIRLDSDEKGSRSNMPVVYQGGAIVIRDSADGPKVLLVRAKRDPRNWIFPKGHQEKGETLAETAVGELAEEAGVVGVVDSAGRCVNISLGQGRLRSHLSPGSRYWSSREGRTRVSVAQLAGCQGTGKF